VSYAMLPGSALGAVPGCEWDMDCDPDKYCCSSPDGHGECMEGADCTKRIDELCATDAMKSNPYCASWNDPKDPGWYEELEGPCASDHDCWPGLACCGNHPQGKFCAPRSMCGRLSSSPGIDPMLVLAGAGVAAVLVLAGFLS